MVGELNVMVKKRNSVWCIVIILLHSIERILIYALTISLSTCPEGNHKVYSLCFCEN